MAIEWKKDYETGEPKVDSQHKKLFECVNHLERLIQTGNPSREDLDRLFNFLGMYVQSHFSYEELCMFQHNCPVARKNRDAHQKFTETYKKFLDRYQRFGPQLALLKELHQAAESWLVNHICKVDTHLRACVAST